MAFQMTASPKSLPASSAFPSPCGLDSADSSSPRRPNPAMVESFLLWRLPIASYAQPAAAPGFDFLSEVYDVASFGGPNAGDYGGEMGFLDVVEPKAASATLVDGAAGLRACKVELGLAESGNAFGAGAAPPPALASKKKRVEGMPSKNLMVERRRRKRLSDRLSMLRYVVPKISKVRLRICVVVSVLMKGSFTATSSTSSLWILVSVLMKGSFTATSSTSSLCNLVVFLRFRICVVVVFLDFDRW
jgi:hypothetical protein